MTATYTIYSHAIISHKYSIEVAQATEPRVSNVGAGVAFFMELVQCFHGASAICLEWASGVYIIVLDLSRFFFFFVFFCFCFFL